MSTVIFLSSLGPIFNNDATICASGTVEFYQTGTAYATSKAVYSDSALSSSLGSIVTLGSAATAQVYLNGDYDIKIKNSSGTLQRSVPNINPSTSVTSAESNNLVINGSFENVTNSVPNNWTLFEYNVGSNVADNTSGNQTHGAYSMKFVTSGLGGGYLTSTDFFTVNALKSLDVIFSVKSTANILNKVDILWYNFDQSANATPTTNLYSDGATNPTSWTLFIKNATPPSGAVYAKLRLTGGDPSNVNSGTCRFDNVTAIQDGALLGGNNTFQAGVVIGTPTGGNKGVGSLNTTTLYVNGSPIQGAPVAGGVVYAYKTFT